MQLQGSDYWFCTVCQASYQGSGGVYPASAIALLAVLALVAVSGNGA
ncbi:hypothetical protein [Streptomyces kasugaensis]|nr:hypothetical protein [Streptomyces kasugaensis]